MGPFGKDNIPVDIMMDEATNEDSEDNGGGNNSGRNSNSTSKSSSTTYLRIRSQSQDAIDSFITTAYEWYLEQIKGLEDSSRYMYEVQTDTSSSSDYSGGRSNGRRQYKRYRLSDEKTLKVYSSKKRRDCSTLSIILWRSLANMQSRDIRTSWVFSFMDLPVQERHHSSKLLRNIQDVL